MIWSHNALAHDLANKFRADTSLMVFEDMPMGSSGSQRPDVYVLPKSYARFTPRTYEVKVSKSDFRADITAGKWQGYRKYSSAVIFAAPAGLISKADVPAECGLILRHDEVWRMAKAPTLNVCETLPHDVWMKLLIDGRPRMDNEAIKAMLPRVSPNGWMVEEKLRKAVGDDIAKLVGMARRARESVEREVLVAEEKAREIREGANGMINAARETARREATTLGADLRYLATVLGLPEDCGIRELCIGIHRATERLGKDDEIKRLRGMFRDIQRTIERAAIPLPGENAAPFSGFDVSLFVGAAL